MIKIKQNSLFYHHPFKILCFEVVSTLPVSSSLFKLSASQVSRLNDKDKTELTVLPPSKNLYEKVVLVRERLQQLLKTDLEDASAGDIVGDIYEVVALTMSRNREEIIFIFCKSYC